MFLKFFVNFGLKKVIKNGFNLLRSNEKAVTFFLESLIIDRIRPIDLPGVEGEGEQEIKDKAVMLIRVVLSALYDAFLSQEDYIMELIEKNIKV